MTLTDKANYFGVDVKLTSALGSLEKILKPNELNGLELLDKERLDYLADLWASLYEVKDHDYKNEFEPTLITELRPLFYRTLINVKFPDNKEIIRKVPRYLKLEKVELEEGIAVKVGQVYSRMHDSIFSALNVDHEEDDD